MRGVTMDFSQHKATEQERDGLLAEARELNRVKDQFLTTLSHEVRTPINAVLGWTQMLRAAVVQGDRARAMAAGVDRHIVKPIDVADVIMTVATLGRPSNL
jgi:signal transduction histidine kinase